VPVYASELNQVWTNLIDNAVQAMAGAGTLTTRTAHDRDRVRGEIGDTGPGVPPEIRRRILERFFTTKPVGTAPPVWRVECRRLDYEHHDCS
jgi:signal transduction histidine kinase